MTIIAVREPLARRKGHGSLPRQTRLTLGKGIPQYEMKIVSAFARVLLMGRKRKEGDTHGFN